MANSDCSPALDANNVLVHSFQLDADADFCSLPICFPGKQAMFHKSRNFSSHLSNFIPYQEGVKMIEDINKILLETAFPNRQCNPFIIICILLSMLSVGFSTFSTSSLGILMLGMFLPYVIYFGLMIYKKTTRKSSLLTFVLEWNETKNNGVILSIGGGGNVRGVAVGSETGGTYENFHMATWDPKSLLVRGYLHIFVNYQKRANWCQQNGVPFIPPVSPHQQTMEQQLAHQGQVPAQDQVPAPPAGYALVPQPPQPPPEFQVPAGYALVPLSQDSPPSYNQASKM